MQVAVENHAFEISLERPVLDANEFEVFYDMFLNVVVFERITFMPQLCISLR